MLPHDKLFHLGWLNHVRKWPSWHTEVTIANVLDTSNVASNLAATHVAELEQLQEAFFIYHELPGSKRFMIQNSCCVWCGQVCLVMRAVLKM